MTIKTHLKVYHPHIAHMFGGKIQLQICRDMKENCTTSKGRLCMPLASPVLAHQISLALVKALRSNWSNLLTCSDKVTLTDKFSFIILWPIFRLKMKLQVHS